MYSDSEKRIPFFLPVLLLAVCALIAVFVIRGVGRDERLAEEGRVAIEDAIQRSAKQCYVVEGVYPPDLAYLENNYGLQVNTKDYYITYDAFASNLPPNVIVTAKHEDGGKRP